MCTPACEFNRCGDAWLGGDEECDYGNGNGVEGCTVSCTRPISCADGGTPVNVCDDAGNCLTFCYPDGPCEAGQCTGDAGAGDAGQAF
jgi:hypothetical protein